MNDKKYQILLISEFTINNLAAYINNSDENIQADILPFYEMASSVFDNSLNLDKYDMAVIWTQPHSVITSFMEKISFNDVSVEKIFEEIDNYSEIINKISSKIQTVLLPLWINTYSNRGYGLIDLEPDTGIAYTLMKMNLRLIENFRNKSNIFVLNSQNWIINSKGNPYNEKLWFMGKIPFSNSVFTESSKEIISAVKTVNGLSRKLIIVDLDDTLWGGIVGDDGVENLVLGGHHHTGESFAEFQKILKSYTNRGIILGIVSKNNEETALYAIKNHPEMVLEIDDFAGWKINWEDKARNILELSEELNIGLQSIVFIDDNPVERDRVRTALPEVLVPEWPKDKLMYKKAFLELDCFDQLSISKEDTERTKMYSRRRKVEEEKKNISSIDEWIRKLEIKLKIEKFSQKNIKRIVQLINKTNQMNLTTRRLTEEELLNWMSENNELFSVRVKDKFGDSGLTGIVSISIDDDEADIIDFILSCRVMGRKIEESILCFITDHCREKQIKKINAVYKKTEKNAPCFKVFKDSQFSFIEEKNLFYFDTENKMSMNENIDVEILK